MDGEDRIDFASGCELLCLAVPLAASNRTYNLSKLSDPFGRSPLPVTYPYLRRSSFKKSSAFSVRMVSSRIKEAFISSTSRVGAKFKIASAWNSSPAPVFPCIRGRRISPGSPFMPSYRLLSKSRA